MKKIIHVKIYQVNKISGNCRNNIIFLIHSIDWRVTRKTLAYKISCTINNNGVVNSEYIFSLKIDELQSCILYIYR